MLANHDLYIVTRPNFRSYEHRLCNLADVTGNDKPWSCVRRALQRRTRIGFKDKV